MSNGLKSSPSLTKKGCNRAFYRAFRAGTLLCAAAAFFALVAVSAPCRADASDATRTEAPAAARYKIHLINVAPGGELFMRFGHIAIIVEDANFGIKKVYNFGTFDFADPALRFRYVRGFLNYWLSVAPYELTLNYYRSIGRGATLRTLNLSPRQAEKVARRLEINARPENATYAYRHYVDNCCTRIRDLLDDVLDGAISKAYDKEPTGRSYRYWTLECLRGMPVMRTVILMILSGEIDKPVSRWDEEFLPEILAEDLDNLRIGPNQMPMVSRKETLFSAREPETKDTPPREIIPFVALFSLLILGFSLPAAFPKKRWAGRFLGLGLFTWSVLGGLGGAMLIFLWTATTHYDTHYNENILIFPVLHLWLSGPGVKLLIKGRISPKTARVIKRYMIFCLGLIVLDLALKLGPFIQSNYGYTAFAAAANLGVLFALRRIHPARSSS